MERLDELLLVLISAIETDYCPWQSGQCLADTLLEAFDPLPAWLLDLYDATNKEATLGALWAKVGNVYQYQPTDGLSLHLAFLYLSYKRGDFTVEQLLHKAGDKADRANRNGVYCEDFYLLLSERDGLGSVPITPAPATFDQRVFALFEEHIKQAQPYLPWLANIERKAL